ncbi:MULTISPECIES: lipocalin family protein [Aequorivita]|uniref:Lipocalin family protein n=2 Tax=Aequorivita TaxID=153265 RepID=A0AB35YNM7_9FLAO|nr:lipocalin family protein [Aequorivita sp. Ant34-E75]WGF93774.1 hypothetical protein QCQ61_06195 [Aequorivita sp. Ant34-E75]
MKKLFGLLFLALAFTACSSDDDSSSNEASIEGTWKMTAFNTENAYDLNNDGTASTSVMDETNCYQNETIVFNADGTGTAFNTSYADIELTLVAGTTDEYEYTVTCVSEDDSTPFLYTQNGNTITLTMGGFNQDVTLSGNTLTYVFEEGFYVEVDNNGTTTTVTEDITFVFTKQ